MQRELSPEMFPDFRETGMFITAIRKFCLSASEEVRMGYISYRQNNSNNIIKDWHAT